MAWRSVLDETQIFWHDDLRVVRRSFDQEDFTIAYSSNGESGFSIRNPVGFRHSEEAS